MRVLVAARVHVPIVYIRGVATRCQDSSRVVDRMSETLRKVRSRFQVETEKEEESIVQEDVIVDVVDVTVYLCLFSLSLSLWL